MKQLKELCEVACSGFCFGIYLVMNLFDGLLYLVDCNLQCYWPEAWGPFQKKDAQD